MLATKLSVAATDFIYYALECRIVVCELWVWCLVSAVSPYYVAAYSLNTAKIKRLQLEKLEGLN